MFFTDYEPLPVENTKTVKMICSHCGNESEHAVCDELVGLAMGFPWGKRPWFSSHKRYYLVCPVCSNATKKINKDEVKALKK